MPVRLTPWLLWTTLLGFALGGFFDGILLHQVLQWHHLLSLVPGMEDLRRLVLWDGLFHVLMYAIAALALWGVWRTRAGMARGRHAAGALLLGFGLWNVADIVLFHWVLQIHRIRVDVSNPLLWDLGWLFVFGVLPLLAGWRLLDGPPAGQRPGHAAASVAALGLLTAGAGLWALQPPPDQPFTLAVFRAGMDEAAARSAVAPLGAVLLSMQGGIAVLDMAPARRWRLYRAGALMVGGTGLPVCLGWSDPRPRG
jgi:uncharacterized membrane protein